MTTKVRAELGEVKQYGPRILIDSAIRDKELIKQLPGAYWDPALHTWHMPVASAACHQLKATFNSRLMVGPELMSWAMEDYETRVVPCMDLRTRLELGDWDSPAADVVRSLRGRFTGVELRPYQEVGVVMLATAQQVLLADDLGLGKSAMTLATMRVLFELGHDPFPALVVAPKSVKHVWKGERALWCEDLRLEVLTGGPKQRRETLAAAAEGDLDVVVANWEQLKEHSRLAPFGAEHLKRCEACADDEHPADVQGGEKNAGKPIRPSACHLHPKEMQWVPWKTMVCDEAHRLKNPQAQQTRAAWAIGRGLSNEFGAPPFRYALTGTPVSNSVLDLWSMMHFVAPEEYPVKSKWLERYCFMAWGTYGHMTPSGVKPQTRDELHQILDPRLLRRLKTAVASDLPPLMPPVTRYALQSPKERKAYEQMRDLMIAEVENGAIVAQNALVASGRLFQLAAAFAEVDTDASLSEDEVKIRLTLTEPSCKLDVLDEILEETDKPLIVAARHVGLLELAAARFDKVNDEALKNGRRPPVTYGVLTGKANEDERAEAVAAFQAGKLRVILCSYGAGAEGITLTRADTLVRLQRDWSKVKDDQMPGRFDRIGQTAEFLTIIDVVTEDSVEETQAEILRLKEARAQEVVRDRDVLEAMLKGDVEQLKLALKRLEM